MVKQLPLHLALAHGASEEVCLELLAVNREAAWRPDSDGKQSIAIAFEHEAPQAVSWALITANPRAVRAKDESGQVAASAGVRPGATSPRREGSKVGFK